MKSNTNQIFTPRSSFLSIEKDFSIITKRILECKELTKILYYSVPNYLEQPDLTEEQKLSLIGNEIRITPTIIQDKILKNYMIIGFDNFFQNLNNPEFKDSALTFDIICNYEVWNLGNFRLRPYRIAGLLDSLFQDQRLSGLGTLDFGGGSMVFLNEEFGGISIRYNLLNGGEDTHNPLTPE